MNLESRPPQQARSRRTFERLLDAAVALLEEEGLAGVTIPRVAARAGVSTGSIYRRFDDKEALVRTAFLRVLEASRIANRERLDRERFAGMTLEAASRAVCRALVRQYRARPALLKALDQFLDLQPDAAFREQAISTVADNVRMVVGLLLPFREHIASADPERAITFALLSAVTVIETHILHAAALWTRMLPLDDDALSAEAARAMAAYLTAPQRENRD